MNKVLDLASGNLDVQQFLTKEISVDHLELKKEAQVVNLELVHFLNLNLSVVEKIGSIESLVVSVDANKLLFENSEKPLNVAFSEKSQESAFKKKFLENVESVIQTGNVEKIVSTQKNFEKFFQSSYFSEGIAQLFIFLRGLFSSIRSSS